MIVYVRINDNMRKNISFSLVLVVAEVISQSVNSRCLFIELSHRRLDIHNILCLLLMEMQGAKVSATRNYKYEQEQKLGKFFLVCL